MKFNPYAALLMTGALMVLTVVIAQVGSNAALLLKTGVVSVDRDVARFAARTFTSLSGRQAEEAGVEEQRVVAGENQDSRTRVAAIDEQTKDGWSRN